MKQFDDIFSRKAKEAFESFDADHLAGEGWNSFTQKYGRGRSRRLVIPFWARAASIALLIAAGALFVTRTDQRKAVEPVKMTAQETSKELTDSTFKEKYAAGEGLVIAGAVAVEDTETEKTAGNTNNVNFEQEAEVKRSAITGSSALAGAEAGKTLVSAGSVRTAEAADPITGQMTASATGTTADKITESAGALLAETSKEAGTLPAEAARVDRPHLSEATRAGGMMVAMNLPANPLAIRLTGDAGGVQKLKPRDVKQVYSDVPREKMTTTIMTGLSGMMASIDNSTSPSQGVSIGFYVEQQLTRRISVRPGLAMARHNYGIESTSTGSAAFDYSAPELNGLSGTTTSFEADMEVLSMEVPLNFVFSLWKRAGTNLFVSAGASTLIYLDQHLSGSFNNTYIRSTVDSYGKVSYESMTTSVKIERDQELLNRVDFLGLANFSAGYSLPFSKTTHLLFEPFVQFPVKDLTSLNLRIRYGGLSMKIKF